MSFIYQTMTEKEIPFDEVDYRCPTMQEMACKVISPRELIYLLERSAIRRVVFSFVVSLPWHYKLCMIYSSWPKLIKSVFDMGVEEFAIFETEIRLRQRNKKPALTNWQKEGF